MVELAHGCCTTPMGAVSHEDKRCKEKKSRNGTKGGEEGRQLVSV